MEKKPELIEKKLVFKFLGWTVSRELYEPACDVSRMLFAYGALRKKKTHLVFEDLALFSQYGWKIQYFGKKSKRLQILSAEYLGEEAP